MPPKKKGKGKGKGKKKDDSDAIEGPHPAAEQLVTQFDASAAAAQISRL